MASRWKFRAFIGTYNCFLLAVIFSSSSFVDASFEYHCQPSCNKTSSHMDTDMSHRSNITDISSSRTIDQVLENREEILLSATRKIQSIFEEEWKSETRERNDTEATTILNFKREEATRFQHQMLDRGSEATNLVRLDKTSDQANKSAPCSPGASHQSASASADGSLAQRAKWLKSSEKTMAEPQEAAVEMQTRLAADERVAGLLSDRLKPLDDHRDASGRVESFSSRSQDQTAPKEPLPPLTRAAREVAASDGDVETIRALIGHRLVIPCAVQVAPPGGEPVTGAGSGRRLSGASRQSSQQQVGANKNGLAITLIVWHKDEQLNWPIFSADVRGSSSIREAKQQTNHDSPLKGRAHLEEWRGAPSSTLVPGAALVIDEVGPQDGGVYTCTLEFNKAPTQTRRMRIILIDPPRNMIIRHSLIATGSRHTEREPQDGEDSTSSNTIIEPFDEDSRVSFTCKSDPGQPSGQIAWWQLKSVWSLPATNSGKQRPLAASKLISNSQDDGPEDQGDQRLLTISLLDQRTTYEDNSLPTTAVVSSDQSLTRDYFVAFQHQNHQQRTAANKHSSAELLLAAGNNLPFSIATATATASGSITRATLKQWQRVRQQSVTTLPSGKIQSTLELQLSRSNLGLEYLCLAHNSDFAPPLNSSLKINLNLKLTEVRISNKAKPHPFKVGQKVTIECQAHGSKPEPQIRWFKGLQELEPGVSGGGGGFELGQDGHYHIISEINRDTTTTANNLTKFSYLTLIPQLSDNQQTLTCSAHNPRMTAEPLTDSIVMNVQFAAHLNLQFGPSIKQESIKLDTDVYMDCNVQANPQIDELGWLHNDKPLVANASAGYVMSNQSLIIQRIRIEHRGHYQCVAIQNSMGKFYSNKLDLRPKFEPVCDYSLTRTKYEIPVNQPTRIECNVLAEPTEDLHFVWKFNQTFGSLMPSGSRQVLDDQTTEAQHHHLEDIKQYETNFTKSYIMFTPESKRRYGQLLCSASNSMGKQMRPCVIQVVESVLPDPIFSCFSDNQTKNSLSVHCQSAPDLQQNSVGRINYLLELYRANDSSASLKDDLDVGEEESTEHSAASAVQHLRQREPSVQESMMDDNGNPYDLQQHQQQYATEARPMRKLVSETPTFHLSNLKAGTGYNLVIYVQNAKGRSAPYFYPANTLPDLSAPSMGIEDQTLGTNKIHLGANTSKGQQHSIWDKLTWPPSVAEYLSGNGDGGGSRALLSVALLILLCTLSTVTVAFFVSRMCRARGSSSKPGCVDNNNNKQATCDRRNSASALRGGEDEISKSQSSELRLTNGGLNNTPSRLKALTGSGSDTSRETNTDSTLISIVRPSTNFIGADLTPTSCQMGLQQGSCVERGIFGGSQRRSVTAYGSIRNHNHQTGANLTGSPSIGMLNTVSSQLQFEANDQQQQQQQSSRQQLNSQAGVYSALKRSALGLSGPSPELASANTPQVSIQSGGSDCTSGTATHNDLLQGNVSSSIAEQFSHNHQHSDANLGQQDHNQQQPVYVIGRHHHTMAGALPSPGSGHYTGQLRLLTAHEACVNGQATAGFWAPGSDDQQVNSPHSSSDQQTNSSCRIIGDGVVDIQNGCHQEQALLGSVDGSELPIPISLLQNSMSIPVSLGDCASTRPTNHHQKYRNRNHQHQHHLLHHQLSHEFLPTGPEDLYLQPQQAPLNNGSYLTLAPDQHRVQQVRAASSCCQPVAYLDERGIISGYATTASGRNRFSIVAANSYPNQDHRQEEQFFEQSNANELVHYGCHEEDHQVPHPFAELHHHHENKTRGPTVRFEQQQKQQQQNQESQDNLVMNDNSNEHRD